MLMYFRNPINQVFFNEAIVLAAMHSFGIEQEWQEGVLRTQLFERCVFLSKLLQREEFIKTRITEKNPEFFEEVI